MKTKPVSIKMKQITNSRSQVNLCQAQNTRFKSEKEKTSKNQILSTSSSLKFIQVTRCSQTKKIENAKKLHYMIHKSNGNSTKSKNSDKLKKIKKQKNLKSKVQTIKKSKKILNKKKENVKIEAKTLRRAVRKSKSIENEQELSETKLETSDIKYQKSEITIKQEEIKVDLDDNAEIRISWLDNVQLLTKRDNLLRRVVQDWNQLYKGRSQNRQLRSLDI